SGFSVLILMSLGLSGYSMWSLSNIDQSVEKMTADAASNTRVVELTRAFERVRHFAFRYQALGDESALSDWATTEDEVLSMLKADEATASAERKQIYHNLSGIVSDLKVKRVRLIELAAAVKSSLSTLHALGDDLTVKAEALVATLRTADDKELWLQ